MLGWMNDQALHRTLTNRAGATYWSRSRAEFWVKGETVRPTSQVREISRARLRR